MLGALVTLFFSLGAMGLGLWIVRALRVGVDPAARLGVGGLIGLGAVGLVTLPIGLIPGGLRWGVIVVAALAVFGATVLWKEVRGRISLTMPKGAELLLPVAVTVAVLLSFIGVLAPSTTLDWDSLAYHLAVPKLWLRDGQIHYVSFIHHSNFPFTIDDLYIWGLTWGGQQGAKAFSFVYLVFGILAIFGLARQRFGDRAAWWSTLAFATMPVVIWLSGTAYIDVSNGLYAGLGIVFAAFLIEAFTAEDVIVYREPGKWAWLSAIFLGLAAGSKFTGLQTIAAVCLVVLLYGFLSRHTRRESTRTGMVNSSFLIGLVALAIALPWYLKTFVYTGNPVFPFFYSIFGGRNWSEFNATIYTREQKTFGVGTSPMDLGHAVLGLAYQPGRYINPNQTQGGGFPFGALGVVALCSGLAWCFSGRMRRFEASALAMVGISFLLWFGLSQQSRYIVALAVPLCLLAGAAVARLRVGVLLAVVIALQAAYSLWLINTFVVGSQIQAAFGREPLDQYQRQSIGFYEPAQLINDVAKGGRVALYDEVFGYLLDVPYLWANPGHSTELGYDGMRNGDDLAASLKREGVTHVYVASPNYDRTNPMYQRMVQAMGIEGTPAAPYSDQERKAMFEDLDLKWRYLLADAVNRGELVPVRQSARWMLLALK